MLIGFNIQAISDSNAQSPRSTILAALFQGHERPSQLKGEHILTV